MATTSALCDMCSKPGPQRCQACHKSRYCSRECQKLDWPIHKLVCKLFKDFEERPGGNFRRAIYFPDTNSRPRFIWLPFTWIGGDAGNGEGIYHLPNLDIIFGKGKQLAAPNSLTFNPVLNRFLSHTILINYGDSCLIDGSPWNKSVYAIVDPELTRHWRGPIVAYGMQGVDFDPSNSDDLDTTDFRHIIDYMRSYKNTKLMMGAYH